MKKLAICIILLGLLVGIAPSVYADDPIPDAPTGQVVVTGSTPELVTSNINLPGVHLATTNGGALNQTFDQSVSMQLGVLPNTDAIWAVRDPRGTGEGWLVNIQATDFVKTGAPTQKIPLTLTDKHGGLSSFFMQLTIADITWVDGQFDTTCTDDDCVGSIGGTTTTGGDLMPYPDPVFVADMRAISGIAQTFLIADVNEGMGSYQFAPSFRLDVPAETYVGTYTNTVTITLIPT